MPAEKLHTLAQQNFRSLETNSYPGRLVLAGIDSNHSHLVLGAAITVRTPEFQNREYERGELDKNDSNTTIRTRFHNPDVKTNPVNLLYNTMRYASGVYIVTNGDHTDTIAAHLDKADGHGSAFGKAMRSHTYEDDPVDTPRIAMGIDAKRLLLHAGQIYQGDENTLYSHEEAYSKDVEAGIKLPPVHQLSSTNLKTGEYDGLGFYVRTYMGNLQIPEVFKDHPLVIPLDGTIEELTERYWNALPEQFRVAVVMETVNIQDPYKVKFRTIDKFDSSVRKL